MAKDLIFVTGGTGFLGRHLIPCLINAGFKVRLLVRKDLDISWLKPWDVDLIYGDVTNPQSLFTGMRGCRYVVHAAGFFRFWGPYEVFDNVNLDGTKNVAEAAMAVGVERLIYISTIAVVGNPKKGEIITEETVCNPQDPYQHSKLSAERYLQGMTASVDLPAVILRPGAFYGPGSHYGINRLFVIEPMTGWKVKVEGGKHVTFPVFVPDVVRVILNALILGKTGEIYNVSDASLTHTEINDIVSGILGISKWRLSMPRLPMLALAALQEGAAKITRREPFYPLNLRHYVFNDWEVSSEKSQKELEFHPTALEKGLEETIDWLKPLYL